MEAVMFPPEMGRHEELLASEVLGAGIPAEAEQHLHEAGRAFAQDDVAEWHLREARRIAPEHAAILIAFYRYYFYKGRLEGALEVARTCLVKAAVDLGFESHLIDDWRQVTRKDAIFDSYEAVLARFFLFTLKGYAYLQMRLGNFSEGRDAVLKLLELDPGDKIGATVLLDVMQRMGKSEDE
jgi:tetratricopeptide (TPR) repeat protein